MRIYTVSEVWIRRLALLLVMLGLVLLTWITLHRPRPALGVVTKPQDRYSVRDVITNKRALALTFDISWGTIMPSRVFNILKKDHVSATFFVSGPWARQNPALIKSMVKAGDQVESHGWAHVNYTSLSQAGIQENLQKAGQVIEAITGKRPTLVRPPNGDFSARTIAAARSIGYTTVTWGTDSLDWMNPGVSTIIRRVVTRAHPGDIVLLHASDTCKQTDLALPTIVKDLRSQGYRLLTVSQLLAEGTPQYRG